MQVAWRKSLILGAAVGLLGAGLLATPLGLLLEVEAGLPLLFQLRGSRPAPEGVVIVSIDKRSADELCAVGDYDDRLCPNGTWWPRTVHAQLVERLTQADAGVIVFDLVFDRPRDENDFVLSRSIGRAGRVALAEFVKREDVKIPGGMAFMDKIVGPAEPIRSAAVATAPFTLPKLPVRVSSYHPFLSHMAESATLPVVAFLIHARQAYGVLRERCNEAAGGQLPAYPADALAMSFEFRALVTRLRQIMVGEPDLAAALLGCVRGRTGLEPSTRRTIEALLDVFGHEGPRYLDLYGPAQTITTISYSEALSLLADDAGRKRFSGKAVFVGLSDALQSEQRDNYYTVFSGADGVDLNGVELAATGFANLLENRTLRWHLGWTLVLTFAWGLAVGMVACAISPLLAAIAIAMSIAIYLGIAHTQFAASAAWLPLVVPLLLQAPLAFAAGALRQYSLVNREKLNIRRAFGHFLPETVVTDLARDVGRIAGLSQSLSGTCLSTDVSGYTSIAEAMDPSELRSLMNAYYARLFAPVKASEGIVCDIVGDAMVAIWASAADHASLRTKACRAALEIATAAEAFGAASDHPPLPTRIGLECGQVALGNVGGIGHYEYRAVGDIVNTASRIAELNKRLGTRVLVSAGVLEGVDGFLSRPLGEFRLRGKARSVSVRELMGYEASATSDQLWLCRKFLEMLGAMREQRWDEARKLLDELLERFPDDGPTRFYSGLLDGEHAQPRHQDGIMVMN